MDLFFSHGRSPAWSDQRPSELGGSRVRRAWARLGYSRPVEAVTLRQLLFGHLGLGRPGGGLEGLHETAQARMTMAAFLD